MDAVTLYTTWPDAASAKAAARALVDKRLAACANILPNAVSVFRWDGAIAEESEAVMLIKTSAARAAEASEAIVSLHPYDTPCVTALRVDPSCSNPAFIEWIGAETA